MSKNLVIVESPAKAKTIEKYLGKEYSVKSSFGHIRDLPKKGINIDIEHNFAPTYEINSDKKKVVSELRKAAKEAADVWLARSSRKRPSTARSWASRSRATSGRIPVSVGSGTPYEATRCEYGERNERTDDRLGDVPDDASPTE